MAEIESARYYHRGYIGVVYMSNGVLYGEVLGTNWSFDTDPIEDSRDNFEKVVDQRVGYRPLSDYNQ